MSLRLVSLMAAVSPLLVGCIFLPMGAEEKAKYAEYHRATESPATYEAMDCNTLLITRDSYDQYPTPRTEKIRQVIHQVVAQRDCSRSSAIQPSITASPAPTATAARAPIPAQSITAPVPVAAGHLGAHLGVVTPAVVKSFGLPSEKGVLVFGPEAGADTAKMGLLAGDIILEIAGAAVNSPSEVTAIIGRMTPSDSALIKVWRYRAVTDVRVVVSDGSTAH
ncbi:PDZ domain-containing protein [Pseudomonas kilonensis]|uniref:PDZ domain-containing protein n=1 Tax=Pseudomonas kilonensis TaxID=132476 RepID=UPI00209FBE0D|nr:PDZ domain-containing protein [Pseudomonas kilonensis]